MKHRIPAVVVLFVLCLQPAVSQRHAVPLQISIRPTLDMPVESDANMFRTAAGASIIGSYTFPNVQFLSAGIAAAYHLGRLSNAVSGYPGSLSVISGEGFSAAQVTLGQILELSIFGGAGLFYAFFNEETSSSVSNLVWNCGTEIGFRASPSVTVGVFGEYRKYETLYHYAGIGVYTTLRIGGLHG